MSIKKILVGLAAALIFGIAALFIVIPVLSQGPALPLGEYDLEAGQYVFNVPELAVPTDTPVPPTETPEPAHDDRAWHPVSETISHEHKGNPHDLDGVFGTQIYTWAGDEISYPWQTFVGADETYPSPPGPGQFENDFKHEGYGWIVEPNIAETVGFPILGGEGGAYEITDVRIQIHSVQAGIGITARFHSFWAEARMCRVADNECGTIHTGGWGDYGFLNFNGVHVPLPNDPSADFLQTNDSRRSHDAPAFGIWYTYPAEFGHAQVGYAFGLNDVWVALDVNDPLNSPFICPDFQCEFNSSTIGLGFFKSSVKANSVIDPDGDGLADFSGFTDRYGNIVNGCSEPGLDCVPLEMVNFPVDEKSIAFRTGIPIRDYDISPPGEFWIEYPN